MSETPIETPDYGGQVIVLSILNDAALDELRLDVVIEQEKRYVLANAEQRAQEIANQYADATADAPAEEWQDGQTVGPGRIVTEGGKEYRNVSGAWLSVPPSKYPLGYRLKDAPSAATVPDWKPGEAVKPGDMRGYNGMAWKVLQAHTTQAGWEPDVAVSLWARA